MSFYEELCSVYDIVFPEDADTTKLLKHNITAGESFLDVACATGSYALSLSKAGFSGIGIDLSQKMIDKANERAKELSVEFLAEDMTNLSYAFSDKSFNLIYCIGNSLVHLHDKAAVKDVLTDMYSLLKKQGKVILQIINYDRILKHKVTSLPTIDRESDGVKFIRNYKTSDDGSFVNFETTLTIKDKKYDNSIQLITIKCDELVEMLREIGFRQVDAYEDFTGNSFDRENSYMLVIRAQK